MPEYTTATVALHRVVVYAHTSSEHPGYDSPWSLGKAAAICGISYSAMQGTVNAACSTRCEHGENLVVVSDSGDVEVNCPECFRLRFPPPQTAEQLGEYERHLAQHHFAELRRAYEVTHGSAIQ